MMATANNQRKLLLILIGLYVLAAVIYIIIPGGALASTAAFTGVTTLEMPLWQMVLGNAAFILVLYIPLGLIGLWLARKAGLPGIYRAGARPVAWLVRPLWVGVAAGVVLVIADLATQRITDFAGFAHPPFPGSLLASFTAGVGEEIIFRLFLMSLWVFILGWLAKRFLPNRRTRRAGLWLANIIAALGFAAGHLGTAMAITGASSPAALPPVVLAELFLLNGLVGILSGELFIRDGLVAASGVHFWADIIWHVLYGLLR